MMILKKTQYKTLTFFFGCIANSSFIMSVIELCPHCKKTITFELSLKGLSLSSSSDEENKIQQLPSPTNLTNATAHSSTDERFVEVLRLQLFANQAALEYKQLKRRCQATEAIKQFPEKKEIIERGIEEVEIHQNTKNAEKALEIVHKMIKIQKRIEKEKRQ